MSSGIKQGSQLKSLSALIDKARSQMPILDFEYFTAYPFDEWHVWMEFEGSEGMQVQRAAFMGMLAKFWEENF